MENEGLHELRLHPCPWELQLHLPLLKTEVAAHGYEGQGAGADVKIQVTARRSDPRMNQSCRHRAQFPDESCVRSFPADGSDASQQCGFFVSPSLAHSHPGGTGQSTSGTILGVPSAGATPGSEWAGPGRPAAEMLRPTVAVPRGRQPGLRLASLPLLPSDFLPSQLLTKNSYC